jgi:hypothetical protein
MNVLLDVLVHGNNISSVALYHRLNWIQFWKENDTPSST